MAATLAYDERSSLDLALLFNYIYSISVVFSGLALFLFSVIFMLRDNFRGVYSCRFVRLSILLSGPYHHDIRNLTPIVIEVSAWKFIWLKKSALHKNSNYCFLFLELLPFSCFSCLFLSRTFLQNNKGC